MKRLTVISAAVLLLVAASLFAQHGGRGPNGGGANNAPAGVGRGPENLYNFLELTADQKTQWEALHEQFRASMQPIFEQQKALRDQIATLLDTASPDPAAVGALVISEHALREQVRTQHETLQNNLKALLTPEQLTKFEAFLAARGGGHRGPGGFGPGAGEHPACTGD